MQQKIKLPKLLHIMLNTANRVDNASLRHHWHIERMESTPGEIEVGLVTDCQLLSSEEGLRQLRSAELRPCRQADLQQLWGPMFHGCRP